MPESTSASTHKRRSGMAWCVVSANINHGTLNVPGLRICRTQEEAERLAEIGDNTSAQQVWIEEHDND